MEEVGAEEKTALLTMFKSMLAYRPEEQLTAKAALESAWIKEWGLPELEKMKKLQPQA